MNEIEKHNLSSALETVVEADSALQDHWTSYLAKEYENGEYLGDRDYFNDMDVIANYLVVKWSSGQTECFTTVFDTLEEIFTSRDEVTCSILSAGLLESIQSGKGVDDYYGFDKWLKPKTKEWWDRAIDYWEGIKWRKL